MDKNFTRWVHASVRQFVSDQRTTLSSTIKIFNEADIRQTNKDLEHLELRIDGPFDRNIGTAADIDIRFEINILVNTVYHENEIFRHQNNMGVAAAILNNRIPVYKIGSPTDDRSLIGYLQLDSEILTSNFGQIDNAVQVQQATVEAHYNYEEC